MLMEDALLAVHHLSMLLQANHAILMDACSILLEDAHNAIKHMLFFTTAVNSLIALLQAMEDVLNVILTIFSPPMESVYQRMSSVIKWMSMELASSA